MAKNNEDYWKERFEQLEDAQDKKGAEYFAELEKQYNKAALSVQADIERWYTRFAINNSVSLQDARKLLNSNELEEFRWNVMEYIEKGKSLNISNQWAKQLENASIRFHISRLDAIKLQIQNQVEVLYGNELDEVTKLMTDIYTDGYYHTAYEIQKGFNIGYDLMKLDDNKVAKVLSKPWAADGSNFSDRIWKHKSQLLSELHNGLTQAIIRGQNPSVVTDAIAKRFNVSKGRAGALVMTESAFFAAASNHDCYKDLGVEQYEILATLDKSTSDICRALDGKVFSMSEYAVGVTAPPFHVRCRTTTVPFFDDEFELDTKRAARDENGKTYYVPSDMKYEDWKKAFVDGGSKDDIEKIGKSAIIKTDIVNTQDDIPSELQASKDYYDTWNQNKIKDFAQQHLNNIGLGQFKVKVQNMKGASGACSGYLTPGTPIQYTEYKLRSTDPRTMPYKVKTALHESYHLKSHGLSHDRPSYTTMSGYSQSQWSKWEETFTECSAHYMADCIGIKGIAPSYANYLVETLPKLKASVPEFANCNTISDFGKVAYKFRFGSASEVTASWESMYLQTRTVQYNFIDYAIQYIPYVKKHKDKLIDLVHEQMISGNWSRSNIEQSLDSVLNRLDNLQQGQKLTLSGNNEKVVFENIIINAMNLEGVK